jgi:AcrR family transcriptional regulator
MKRIMVLKPSSRGRPPAKERRQVIRDLLDTTERALATKIAKEITVREISRDAGTHEAMISYYFGSKYGLLVAVFQKYMKNYTKTFEKDIVNFCVSERSIRPLIYAIFDHYYNSPSFTRMCVVELLSDISEISDIHNKDYNRSTHKIIHEVIIGLIDAEVYHRDIDLNFVSIMICMMIIGPILQPNQEKILEIPKKIDSSGWPDIVSRTIDSAFSV